jgi:hypothetical protein
LDAFRRVAVTIDQVAKPVFLEPVRPLEVAFKALVGPGRFTLGIDLQKLFADLCL